MYPILSLFPKPKPKLMKKQVFLFLVLLVLAPMAKAQHLEADLTDSAFASVLTCGPGEEFYTSFGHSAIRVCDSTLGLDLVYNYGTFDFDKPHFYWSFACGRLDYCLSRTTYESFLFEYAYEGRAVWEQKLRISKQELNNLFVLLETNYLPQYRYYSYDFFRDNCATRVRDMVVNCLDHRRLSPETVADTNLSYRDIVYKNTEESLLWWRLGVDIALGQRCDHRCSNYEYMFSPIEMMHLLDTMKVDNTQQPVVDPSQQVLAETRMPLARSISPTLLFWVLFFVVLLLTLFEWSKNWRLNWLDAIIYSVTFLVSVLVVFLWFFTEHYCTKPNFNILWASPLFLYFAIAQRRSKQWMICLQMVMLLAAMVMTIGPLPQQLNAAILPISLILFCRLLANLRHRVR